MQSEEKSYLKLYSTQDDKSYVGQHLEDVDLGPDELSGDENGEQSIFVSAAETHKASSHHARQTSS
jgi:hypothetical protein